MRASWSVRPVSSACESGDIRESMRATSSSASSSRFSSSSASSSDPARPSTRSFPPVKYTSKRRSQNGAKRRSNPGASCPRLTSVDRSAPRNEARSSIPTSKAACAASAASAGEIRSPFCRSSPAKSSRRSSIGVHGSVPRMWMLVLAGALLDRGRPALDAVRPQAISATVRFLSDDLLEGRGTGTRGHAIAEQYVAAQMQALGLRPAVENGFGQRVKLCEARAQGGLTVDGAAVADVLVAGDCGAPERDIEATLAVAGYGQDSEIGDVRGKIAMVLSGAPASLPSTQRALASANEDK